MNMNQNIFDSRAIRRTDCYAQRFMRPGKYPYHILPAGTAALNDDRPYMIVVKDGDKAGEMKQHNVFIKGRSAQYAPDNKELTIDVGDLVLWNCVSADVPPFVIAGDHEFFDSGRLTNECGYSHAFGHPGEYSWKDAYGSGIGGVVKVVDPACKCEADVRKWRAKLGDGTIVMIADGKAQPDKVEIVTGQTVFFAVVTSPGISITDERFLEKASSHC
ncbi:hypothetical protein BH11PSE5_BH11PSE5_18990 [soil metagenome]|jgi:plastocyanin|uniref:cupredoxin domain-containing protein n=1 Tax=unclassified Sphingobium TaxID=2611147 RepID=UPI001E52303D|nr:MULTISPECIES: hypothetical protein [unclassified Sphingobium]GLI98639.1 hypothetical protein Sbs19_24570 [Sphingobium sp. BS19]CAH0352498.1 hypothetical protein SPH9361_02113 [Sphingobium sp. CECT 9361]